MFVVRAVKCYPHLYRGKMQTDVPEEAVQHKNIMYVLLLFVTHVTVYSVLQGGLCRRDAFCCLEIRDGSDRVGQKRSLSTKSASQVKSTHRRLQHKARASQTGALCSRGVWVF